MFTNPLGIHTVVRVLGLATCAPLVSLLSTSYNYYRYRNLNWMSFFIAHTDEKRVFIKVGPKKPPHRIRPVPSHGAQLCLPIQSGQLEQMTCQTAGLPIASNMRLTITPWVGKACGNMSASTDHKTQVWGANRDAESQAEKCDGNHNISVPNGDRL